MSDEMTFTLHHPLTDEEWDMITDVDLDHTSEIMFHTKNGRKVVFVKRKTGKWIKARYVLTSYPAQYVWNCSECGKSVSGRSAVILTDYCPNCGADMRGKQNGQ